MVDAKKLIQELEKTHPRTRVEKILVLLRELDRKKERELVERLLKMLEQSKRELAFMREWSESSGGLEQSMMPRGVIDEERIETPRPQRRNILEQTVQAEPGRNSNDEKVLYSSGGSKLYEEKFYSQNQDRYEQTTHNTETNIARESGTLVEGGAWTGKGSKEKKYHRREDE